MPYNDDETRRTAHQRSQARRSRSGGSSSRSSGNSPERSRQKSRHLSQSRYAGQSSRQDSNSPRDMERSGRRSQEERSAQSSADRRSRRPDRSSDRNGSTRSERTSRAERSSRSERANRSERSSRSERAERSSRSSRDERQRSASRDEQRRSQQDSSTIASNLPSFAVPVIIGVVGVIVLLALIFGVLVPSCSRTDSTPSNSASSSSSESQSAASQGIVYTVGQAKIAAQTSVETADQMGSLETSNTNVEALVTLLGEEEAAKLIAQAKTNPDALWIAAHPDEYAFDGIEIQYKILKLAADEPASIPYVREFPAKYPEADAVTDKELAMDVASPSSTVPNTNIPHLYQWDRRWAYTIYSSASFGLTGCGPTSLAMVYQGLNRTVDRTPHDMAVLAEDQGYMSEFNGTDSSFFINVAPELGLECWDEYPDEANIRAELSQGHVIIANLGPGYFTTNGHFFVLAGLTDDGKVIVNDPYSVVRSSQTWDADFIASETMAMFVYAKA